MTNLMRNSTTFRFHIQLVITKHWSNFSSQRVQTQMPFMTHQASSESDAGQETEASDESLNESDISGLSDTQDSETQESYQDLPARHSRKSTADTKQSFH